MFNNIHLGTNGPVKLTHKINHHKGSGAEKQEQKQVPAPLPADSRAAGSQASGALPAWVHGWPQGLAFKHYR